MSKKDLLELGRIALDTLGFTSNDVGYASRCSYHSVSPPCTWHGGRGKPT